MKYLYIILYIISSFFISYYIVNINAQEFNINKNNNVFNQDKIANDVNNLYKEVDKIRKELGFNNQFNQDNLSENILKDGIKIGNFEIYKDNGVLQKEMQKVKDSYENLQQKMNVYKNQMNQQGDKIFFDNNKADETAESAMKNIFNDRIYIFISSSVPKETWKNYIYDIDKYELYNNIFFVLRGCINGCEKMHPTAEFLNTLLIINPDNKEYYKAMVLIDPLLFRTYNISQVPCVSYLNKIEVFNSDLSEGLESNIKEKSKNYISCGDYSLKYHLKELYKQSNSSYLKLVLNKIGEINEKNINNN
jgi:type-F conjugative transfer system pilin assembly protein TrbC